MIKKRKTKKQKLSGIRNVDNIFSYIKIPESLESFREKLIEDLLLSIDELNSIFREEEESRESRVSYEIAEIVTLARIIKKLKQGDEQ